MIKEAILQKLVPAFIIDINSFNLYPFIHCERRGDTRVKVWRTDFHDTILFGMRWIEKFNGQEFKVLVFNHEDYVYESYKAKLISYDADVRDRVIVEFELIEKNG